MGGEKHTLCHSVNLLAALDIAWLPKTNNIPTASLARPRLKSSLKFRRREEFGEGRRSGGGHL